MGKTCTINVSINKEIKPTNGTIEVYGINATVNNKVTELTYNGSSLALDLYAYNYDYFCINYISISCVHSGGTYTSRKDQYYNFTAIVAKECTAVMLCPAQTVAVAYAFNQLFSFYNYNTFYVLGSNQQLNIALKMKRNFISDNGELSDVISSSPNGLETNSWAMWNSLTNLFCSIMVSRNLCEEFESTTGQNSYSYWLYNLINNPFSMAEQAWTLTSKAELWFSPALQNLTLPKDHSNKPNQWTLTIKVNDSGAQNFLIAGPAYIVFDKNDKAWVTNNLTQGTPNSSNFCVVLESDGKPASFSPLFGGGLQGVGFGVTVNQAGDRICFGNFGWGPTQYNPQTGSISLFANDGRIISPSNGYTNGLSRVQGLTYDAVGNLWVTSYGTQTPMAPAPTIYPFESQNSAIVVYLKNDSDAGFDFDNPIIYEFDNPYRLTFDVAIDNDGMALVSCAGIYNKESTTLSGYSGVYKFSLSQNKLTLLQSWDINTDPDFFASSGGYCGFRQVAIDSNGNVYVGAIRTGFSGLIKLTKDLNYVTMYTDKINRPWGITLDGSDTMYVGNFGFEEKITPSGDEEPIGPFGITILKTNADGSVTSDLMTLPTGGHEVMLRNGFPLYGVVTQKDENGVEKPIEIPCYSPLMRITSSAIDRVGNLWVVNNWKPSAEIDIKENPGGDGIVIFLGVAKPK